MFFFVRLIVKKQTKEVFFSMCLNFIVSKLRKKYIFELTFEFL